MTSGLQKFQNAGQNGSFFYYEKGTPALGVLMLLFSFALLVALLSSEARYRKLLEKIAKT